MRAFYSILLLLIMCLVSVASYSDIKYDTNPVISPGNRYVAFERHYPGYRFTEIVVVDIQTKSSKTIAGQLFDLVWKDQLLYAAAGLTNVSIMRPNGQVVHSAWRTGDGFRAVPMEWQQVGSLNWVKDGVTFTAQDLNGTLRAWFMSSLTGQLDNLLDVNPVPIRRRNTAEIEKNKLEITSVGSLLHRRTGSDKLVRLGSAVSPTFSPDGQDLLVVDDKGQPPIRSIGESRSLQKWPDIYLLHRDGNGLRAITKNGGTYPMYHRSGKGFAYLNLSGDIMWANLDGTDEHMMIIKPQSVNRLRWHADGNWFLVQVVEKGMASWQMLRPPSRRLSSFTKPMEIPNPGELFLSPTGRKAVVMRQGPTSGEVDILVRNRNRTIAFEYPPMTSNPAPTASWSADDRYVALSIGGGISILDSETAAVDAVTGRIY